MDYADSCAHDPPEDRVPPPRVLVEAFKARQWGLPEPGGRLDQPAGLVAKMTYALNVYENWSAYLRAEANGNGVKWKKQDPQLEQFINSIIRGKLERDSG